MTYEYAGFIYEITVTIDGRVVATPAPGQHPAAGKEKHRRAAAECYSRDAEEERR